MLSGGMLSLDLYFDVKFSAFAVFAWAAGASRAPPGSSLQKLHAQSSAFLQWLKEAEEEEDDDD